LITYSKKSLKEVLPNLIIYLKRKRGLPLPLNIGAQKLKKERTFHHDACVISGLICIHFKEISLQADGMKWYNLCKASNRRRQKYVESGPPLPLPKDMTLRKSIHLWFRFPFSFKFLFKRKKKKKKSKTVFKVKKLHSRAKIIFSILLH
jgi:hypothetical protein